MLKKFLSLFSRKLPVITYGITVCNEREELERLLERIVPNIKSKDQIIVLQDTTEPDHAVSDLIATYGTRVLHIEAKLDGDFATFKNRLIEYANGDYLFQIDADELPQVSLLKNISSYLRRHHLFDCFSVPRINIVHGITDQYLKKWNWSQNGSGYINFPDYQMRIFNLKTQKIHWTNKVHEKLVGHTKLKHLPIDNYNFCLLHEKAIERQIRQNDFYDENF